MSKIKKALEMACVVDGAHHKQWVIDQMVRALTRDEYDNWVRDYENNGEYVWDKGVAP